MRKPRQAEPRVATAGTASLLTRARPPRRGLPADGGPRQRAGPQLCAAGPGGLGGELGTTPPPAAGAPPCDGVLWLPARPSTTLDWLPGWFRAGNDAHPGPPACFPQAGEVLLKDSMHSFKLWASGRRFCQARAVRLGRRAAPAGDRCVHGPPCPGAMPTSCPAPSPLHARAPPLDSLLQGMLASFQLVRRQDLLAYSVQALQGQKDVLELEVRCARRAALRRAALCWAVPRSLCETPPLRMPAAMPGDARPQSCVRRCCNAPPARRPAGAHARGRAAAAGAGGGPARHHPHHGSGQRGRQGAMVLLLLLPPPCCCCRRPAAAAAALRLLPPPCGCCRRPAAAAALLLPPPCGCCRHPASAATAAAAAAAAGWLAPLSAGPCAGCAVNL